MDPAAFHFPRLAENKCVDLSTIANVATALTVITGVAFGLVEAQRSRRARQERAAYAAVQAILSPEWMKSMIVVHSIPDGSNAAAIEADAAVLNAAHSVGVILEGLGYSVYARIVPLRVVGDLVGDPDSADRDFFRAVVKIHLH